MIVSKNALQVVHTTAAEKGIPILDNVHIDSDGSVVGSNRESVVVVSPLDEKFKKELVIQEEISEELSLSGETIRDIIKFIGTDKKFKGLLDHTDIKRVDNYTGQAVCHDGKRSKVIQTKVYPHPYYDYKSLIQNVFEKRSKVRLVLNRKRFLNLLQTINKICGDSGDFSAIFLEFTENNDLIVRAENNVSKQRVIGVSRGFKTDKWMRLSKWEEELTGGLKFVRKRTKAKKEKIYVRKRRKS